MGKEEKEEFCSNLVMKDITDADNMHAKIVFKNFQIENLDIYHDLYFKSNSFLLAYVF